MACEDELTTQDQWLADLCTAGVTATTDLVVGQNGLLRLDTGCRTGRTRVTVDRLPVSFAPPTVTRTACREPCRTIAHIVLSVVDGRSDPAYHDGAVLVVKRLLRPAVPGVLAWPQW